MAAGLESSSSDYDVRRDTRRMFYKNPIRRNNIKLEIDYETPQEQRRHSLLEYQKKYRDRVVNAARGILQEKFLSELENEEPMEVERYTSQSTLCRSRYHGYRLTMSEWMLDVPEDFSEKWIMVPCPIGKRTVLVATKGITKAYTRRGWIVSTFPSALPGGNSNSSRQQYTILDCIWMEDKKQYYVLDVLAWGNQPITNCEAEFRLFWVKTKISELEELKERNPDTNAYPVLSLPSISCDSDLSAALTDLDNLHPLDGLLFYHRNAQYTFGYTPLVIWLKPFMLPEVLGLFVPSPHDEKPDGYIDYKHYIYQTTQNIRKREFLQALWRL